MRELTKDDVTDADVEAVEEAVGMGCGAWDCVSARKIIAAAWNRRSAVLSLVDASPAPQQTPVAWMSQGGDVSRSAEVFREKGFAEPYIPLYASPASVPESEDGNLLDYLLRNHSIGLTEEGDVLGLWINLTKDDETEKAVVWFFVEMDDDGEHLLAEDTPFLSDEQRGTLDGSRPHATGSIHDLKAARAMIAAAMQKEITKIGEQQFADEAQAQYDASVQAETQGGAA